MRGYKIWTHHDVGGAASSVTSRTDTVIEPGDDGQNLDPIGGFESFTDDWVRMDDGGVGGDQCNNDEEADNCEIDPNIEELLCHMEPKVLIGSAKGLENFDALKKIAYDCVYDESKGCENTWMVLRFLIQLLMLKAKHGWSDSSFSDLLRLLGSLLTKPNFMPKNTYEAEKIISSLSMRFQRILACPYHYILYYDDFEKYENYPNCGSGRYKSNADFSPDEARDAISKKRKRGEKNKGADPHVDDDTCIDVDKNQRKVPALVMWYMPVINRLKRLFSNPKNSKLMIWHVVGNGAMGMKTRSGAGTRGGGGETAWKVVAAARKSGSLSA
jgi:hypothetical protein